MNKKKIVQTGPLAHVVFHAKNIYDNKCFYGSFQYNWDMARRDLYDSPSQMWRDILEKYINANLHHKNECNSK